MFMMGRSIVLLLLLLGLSPLPGCGRSDQPTIRQVSIRPVDLRTATAGLNPPPVEDTCPGSTAHHKIQPKRDPKADSKLASAAVSSMINEALSKKAGASPPKVGDSTPPNAAGRDTADVDSREVRIGGRRLVTPKTWIRERPPFEPILASFSLPRAPGDGADAQLTVAVSGQNNPRSVQRLRELLDQQVREGSVEHLRIGDGEVVLVESSGDSGDPSDPLPAPVNQGRYRALNATVFVDGRVYSINCTGPEKTVGERAGEFRGFLQTMKSVDYSLLDK
jgi:hypothetical protein